MHRKRILLKKQKVQTANLVLTIWAFYDTLKPPTVTVGGYSIVKFRFIGQFDKRTNYQKSLSFRLSEAHGEIRSLRKRSNCNAFWGTGLSTPFSRSRRHPFVDSAKHNLKLADKSEFDFQPRSLFQSKSWPGSCFFGLYSSWPMMCCRSIGMLLRWQMSSTRAFRAVYWASVKPYQEGSKAL